MNGAAGSRVIPFDTFLDLLRSRGYGISLHEYNAVALLLDRWSDTNVEAMGDAIAALVGRNAEEVDGIRDLFRAIYVPPPPVDKPQPPPRPRARWLREHVWTLGAVATALIVAATLTFWPARIERNERVGSVVPPVVAPNDADAVALPPPPAPELPPPPRQVDHRAVAGTLGTVFLGALSVFWWLQLREQRRRWLREAWAAMRATLPGPYQFVETVRDLPARLPKADVEDAATLLGRVFSKQGLARELDVVASLHATLKRGLMPTLITRARRVAEPILVFRDVSQEMRLWDGKVRALLADLRRQGVSLQQFYFDGDVSRVSERPHRPGMPLDVALRARPDAPVLFIGAGTGLAGTLSGEDRRWLEPLHHRVRTAWLTPVADVRLWPREFAQLPLDVWPMTRLGLLNAARQLADFHAEAGPTLRARLASEGRVSREDIERLKRLAALAPHPTPPLLELLRQRFAPDVPDAAVLHVMNEAEGPAAQVIRLPDAEIRQLLTAFRYENPALEEDGRNLILRVLADSEPTRGSAAHERWQIAVELQRLQLADLRGSAPDANAATAALEALGRRSLGDEVRDALRLLPAASVSAASAAGDPAATRISRLLSDGGTAHDLAAAPALASVAPMGWKWPGLRELVPASAIALIVLLAALAGGALPARAIDRLRQAYTLDYAPVPSPSTPRLTIGVRPDAGPLPSRVDLYRGDQLFRSGVAVTAGAPATVALASADTGAHFQVRATLPDNNLGVSPWVWVTSDRLSFVLIDAAPWANVTVTGDQGAAPMQQTPFTAALLPGTYRVHFENPTLGATATLDQTLAVPTAGNRLHVTMPGFSANGAVQSVLGDRPAAKD